MTKKYRENNKYSSPPQQRAYTTNNEPPLRRREERQKQYKRVVMMDNQALKGRARESATREEVGERKNKLATELREQTQFYTFTNTAKGVIKIR